MQRISEAPAHPSHPADSRLRRASRSLAIVALLGAAVATSTALAASGTITTIAGDGSSNASTPNDGPTATTAVLTVPMGVARAADGTLYVTEDQGHRIRKITPGGAISTIAGSPIGTPGFSGDGGPATAATLNRPEGLALAADGTLYIADADNHRVRAIAADGTISTVVGTGSATSTGDGGPATLAAIHAPVGVAVTADGSLLVVELLGNRVRKIAPGGLITTIAGTGVASSTGDGGQATAATLNGPGGVAVAADGSILVTEFFGHRVRKIAPDGTISTFAGTGAAGGGGDGGPAASAQLFEPIGLAFAPDGSTVVTEYSGSRVRRITSGGTITTLAGTGTDSYSGDGGPAATAGVNHAVGAVVTPSGSVIFADAFNNRVRTVDAGLASPAVVVPITTTPAAFALPARGTQNRTRGRVTLTVIAPQAGRLQLRGATRATRKYVKITPSTTTVTAGQQVIVTVSPTASGRRLLKALKAKGKPARITARITGTLTIGSGAVQKSSASYTLRRR